MNMRAPDDGQGERHIAALMAKVDRLVAERRETEAQVLFDEAAALRPEHPLVLHERARRMALGGDAQGACKLLARIVAESPNHLPFWLSFAAALRKLSRHEEELAALERALVINPTHVVVLLQKGAVLDLMNRPRAAAAVYGHALQALTPGTRLPGPVEAHVTHARKRVAENSATIAALLETQLAGLRSSSSAGELRRFERCLDRMLGRARIYTPEPTGMLFPYLMNFEYFDREYFPWLASLEAATSDIREELLAVLNADRDGIQPYVTYDEGLPLNQWQELNNSKRWGAYFLWNQGRREEEHMARCPRTVAVLESTSQVDIPGRGPTAFFSILDARTHIPAHTGVTNTRLTCHLPLLVPPACRFRVGGETRRVQAGSAWVFDDTIEHEAWNDSDTPRAILIFDVWNPQLTACERALVRETTAVLAAYNEAEGGLDASERRP
jgi:aspartyl/asparaginyl beta-hydroxylase (cupin superfamily)